LNSSIEHDINPARGSAGPFHNSTKGNGIMASIGKDKGGYRRILFVAPDGKRKTIRLGKCPQRTAESVKTKVEALVSALLSGQSPDDETSRWVANLDAVMADKLAAVGLIAKHSRATIGELAKVFIASHPGAKPATYVTWARVEADLADHFGADKSLRSIGRAEAEGFRQYYFNKGLAATTIMKRLQKVRQHFAYAVRLEWIEKNSFSGISCKGGDPRERQRYITEEETAKLLNAAPNWVWRTIIALARYGGLRTPSETLSLRLADLDWEHGAITVISPKTEGHGQGTRKVPMFARLRPFLEEAWDMAQEGQTHVIPENLYLQAANGPHGWVNCNLRTTFAKIVDRAGLDHWPRLFHNLRASCESDLAREYPITTVCKWIGNTVAIAARHYVQVTDGDFRKASGATQQAAQKAAQYSPETGGIPLQQETRNPGFAGVCDGVLRCTNDQVEDRGLEPLTFWLPARRSPN
jgi:integrase